MDAITTRPAMRTGSFRTHLAGPETDEVAVEEPLEIRVRPDGGDAHPIGVVMRSPGDDFDLAAGFVLTDGIVGSARDITSLRYGDPAEFNVVEVALGAGAEVDLDRTRASLATAACGICSRRTLDEVGLLTAPVRDDRTCVGASTVAALPDRLLAHQSVFAATGGVHAAGLFTGRGRLVVAREDVGRHNAVDKVVGAMIRSDDRVVEGLVLAVSGRAGFEIVQKALVAGIAVLVAVSAPSSMAVDLAHESGMTLVAFARDGGFSVYTHPHRITADPSRADG